MVSSSHIMCEKKKNEQGGVCVCPGGGGGEGMVLVPSSIRC